MYTARNAGYRAIGVTWGFRSAKELAAAGAEVLVDHPSDIVAMLSQQPVIL
jgi:phosphoglycolate phosphatase